MVFDPFADTDWQKNVARDVQKTASSALEQQCVRQILKTFDMLPAMQLLKNYQHSVNNSGEVMLHALVKVFPTFPISLFARRVLGLASLNIGDFIDEKKFQKNFWFKCFAEKAPVYEIPGRALGMVFGPAPVPNRRLIVTKGFYLASAIGQGFGFKLAHFNSGKDEDMVVLETFDSFLRELKSRWVVRES